MFLFVSLGGFLVPRDVIYDNYIRGKQVGNEGVSTHKSYCPFGVLPWELGHPSSLETVLKTLYFDFIRQNTSNIVIID